MKIEVFKEMCISFFSFLNNTLIPLSSIAVVAASFFALSTFWVMRKQARLERLNILLKQRYSESYRNAKEFLIDWKQRNWHNIQKGLNISTQSTVNSHRRTFSAYFQTIHDLHRAGLIVDDDLKILINSTDLDILFDIVKPLEKYIMLDLYFGSASKMLSWKEDQPFYEFIREKCLKNPSK